MKIGYIQTAPIFGEKEKNVRQVESLIKSITADILVLPELFATGYAFTSKREVDKLAEKSDGATFQFLSSVSKKTGAAVVAGFVEKEENNIYNSAMLVKNGSLIGVYRKLHLFYKENSWFTPGNLPLKVYTINGCKIGMMICFDWIFPELSRSLSLQGCDVLAHPANLVMPYCQTSMRTRCIENRVFAITANRIGREHRGSYDFKFTGASQITAVDGTVLSSASMNKRQVDLVDIDIRQSRNKKINSINHLYNNRRPEFYTL